MLDQINVCVHPHAHVFMHVYRIIQMLLWCVTSVEVCVRVHIFEGTI